VIYAVDAEARVPLWNSDHVLLKDAYVGLGGHAEITPSFPRGGPTLTFSPLAVWDLRLRAWGTWYFGTFGTVVATDDPGFAATPGNLDDAIDAGARTWATAVRFDADTRLKGRVGPVVAIVELQLRRLEMLGSGQDVAFYFDPSELLLVPASGWTVHRDAYVLVEGIRPDAPGDRLLRAGVFGTWSTCVESADESVRLGPIAMWKPTAKPTMPTFFAGAQLWLEGRVYERFTPMTLLAAEWAR
jgi:hypothetical protein